MQNATDHSPNATDTPKDDATAARICAIHLVPDNPDNLRLDEYAFETLDILPSRRAAHKAVKRGDLRLDGATAQPHWRPQRGQRLELLAPAQACPPPYHLHLAVTLEDPWLAVVEKPPGLPVSGNFARTVERALSVNLSPSAEPDRLPWPRPVHRLDAPTAGLLICAKTAGAMVELSRQFQNRAVHKAYRAILAGRLDGQGEITDLIDGRDACTRYQAVDHTPALRTRWITTVDVWPQTGRTHQIRRHFAGLGYPVIGDRTYGTEGQVLKGKGLFLAAVGLQFRHPLDKRIITCTMPEPAKFASLRERENRRWHTFSAPDTAANPDPP